MTNLKEKLILLEDPDKYGLPTDDELEAEKSNRISSIEKDYANRKSNIDSKRKQFQDAEKVFEDACENFKKKNSEKLASLYKDFLEGRILSLSATVEYDEYVNYIYAYNKPLCFDIKDEYGFGEIFVDIKNGDISCDRIEKVDYKNFAKIVDHISNNFNKYVELIKKSNAEETDKCLDRFEDLFTTTQGIDAMRNISSPGHWAYGSRYIVFSAFGKVYRYEDYDSGAYTNNHVHQFRCFYVIKPGWQGCYFEDSPVVKKINPEDVGLKVETNKVFKSVYVEGKIDLSKLRNISESLKEDILPSVELEEPIVVEEEPVVEPEVKDLGFATMLNDLIKRTYENIDTINSTLVTLADLCEDEEKCNQVKEVLGTILDDEHLHIGQLQKATELFSDSAEKVEDGREEVEINKEESEEE